MLVAWRNKCSLKPAEKHKKQFPTIPQGKNPRQKLFLVQELKQPKGTPKQLQEQLDEILQDLEKQVLYKTRP